MGGINPPTNSSFSLESVRLSRKVSLARTQFEMSNVAFEELLLSELINQIPSNTVCVIGHLRQSITHILKAVRIIDEHLDKIDLLNVVGHPEAFDVEYQWDSIGERLVDKGIVTFESWSSLKEVFQGSHYKDILNSLKKGLEEILTVTQNLSGNFKKLSEYTEVKIHEVMDQNLGDNPKEAYARLYTSWHEFQGLMLASSLFLSEVSYRHHGYKSLVEELVSQD
ncbi:hypothetical protein GW764_00615 [Candidatus Parcubacteria bacterium]|nr:hypothetical protein [Candidatus Parcubacteria bacterium]